MCCDLSSMIEKEIKEKLWDLKDIDVIIRRLLC